MREPGGRLRHRGQADRRAHLGRDRLRQIGDPRLIFGHDAGQQRLAFFDAGLAEGLERAPRGGDRLVDIGGGAQRNLGTGLLGRGIDDLQVVPPSLSTQAPSIYCLR